MGKAIAIFNQKGGVGKTTTNINLAACLALKGKKVLILDIDPQGNTTSGMGIAKKELDITTHEILIEDSHHPEEAVIPTCVENLDIMPASVQLAGAAGTKSLSPEMSTIWSTCFLKVTEAISTPTRISTPFCSKVTEKSFSSKSFISILPEHRSFSLLCDKLNPARASESSPRRKATFLCFLKFSKKSKVHEYVSLCLKSIPFCFSG